MASVARLAQSDLRKLIRIAVSEHPIDLGRFVTKVLERELHRLKDQLGLDFDAVEVHPGPQPRESADIELYKEGKLVAKLNAKTCVSGNLTVTVRKLQNSIRFGEDGLIILFVLFEREKEADGRMVLALIPGHAVVAGSAEDIATAIRDLLRMKAVSEGYTSYYLVALNEALALLRTLEAIEAREMAERAWSEIRKAWSEIRTMREAIEEMRREIQDLKELLLKVLKERR